MDTSLQTSAYEIVNRATYDELDEILSDYGEERFHRRIAKAIVEQRKKESIVSTDNLVQVIGNVVPVKYKRSKIHPATRTFQALRIAVNDELSSLKEALAKITAYLNPGARLVVISFHSLEDRIAKHTFRRMAKDGMYRILTKKPITASEIEIEQNPRARSAKLRVIEKNA